MRVPAQLAAADYIVGAYVEAHDELDRYERQREPSAIQRAAAVLCNALTHLRTDDPFWEALDDFQRSSGSAQAEVDQALRDVEALVDVEMEVLERAGIPGEAAATISRDLAQTVERFRQWPDRPAAEELREAVGGAGRAACIQASFRKPTSRRGVRRALQIAGGGVVIVTNAAVGSAGFKEVSIDLGAVAIADAARAWWGDR